MFIIKFTLFVKRKRRADCMGVLLKTDDEFIVLGMVN